MLTELQRRKLEKRFSLLDRDGDGYLEEDDYAGLARDMADAFALGATDPARTAALDVTTLLFQRMRERLDPDDTGKIGRDAFLASVERSLVERPERFESIIGPMCRITFDIGDRDGDDKIDRSEFRALMVAGRVSAAEASSAFDGMAGGELMSRAEFHTGCREFYCGADPDAPGNWMYGAF